MPTNNYENRSVVVRVPDFGIARGQDGLSAYEQAVAGGYAGTEAQFNQELSSFKTLHDETVTNATAAAQSATSAGQSATAAAGSAESAASSASSSATSAAAASASAGSAADSASNAASSAASAASSAASADSSASTATQKASEASASATAASESETNAASSKAAAADSAAAAASSAAAIEEYEHDAEAWAIGKRGGQDVPSTDATYHNNSKYYAGQAGTSASTAASSASAASASESNAAASASSAAGSASSAAASAATATEKAGEASTSASAASTSATSAAGSATNAASSATAASASATAAGNAQAAAETAQGKAEDAQEAAEQAQSDAEAAAQSVSQSAAQISQNASDISNLKSAISDTGKMAYEAFKEVAPVSNFTKDNTRIVAATGEIQPGYSDYAATDYLFIPKGGKIFYRLHGYNTGISLLYKYDINKTPVASIVTAGSASPFSGSYTADIDCYICACYAKSNLPCYIHYTERPIGDGYIDTVNNAYGAYKYIAPKDLLTLTGRIVASTGELQSEYTSFKASDYIFIPNGNTVYYQLVCANSGLSVLYLYDVDKNPKRSIVTGGGDGYKTGTFTTTEDCYVRASTSKDTTYITYLRLIPEDNLQSRLDSIQHILPQYWMTYLESKKTGINDFISNVGNHGDFFALVTDYHVALNTGNTPNIIYWLTRNFPLCKMFNLGDVYNEESSLEAGIERLNNFVKSFSEIRLFNAIGNHDLNPYGTGQLTIDDIYNPLFKSNENVSGLVDSLNGYYYFDNNTHKIRYIVLNTGDGGFDSVDNDGTQIAWLVNAMNNTPQGWYICIAAHMLFENYGSGTEQDPYEVRLNADGYDIKAICDGFQNRTSGTTPYGGYSYDFTNANANMACVLVGHCHKNVYVDSSDGYSLIGFDRDALRYPPRGGDNTRTAGNVTEQSLALVSIDTTQKKVACLGIGAGADRTFTFT